MPLDRYFFNKPCIAITLMQARCAILFYASKCCCESTFSTSMQCAPRSNPRFAVRVQLRTRRPYAVIVSVHSDKRGGCSCCSSSWSWKQLMIGRQDKLLQHVKYLFAQSISVIPGRTDGDQLKIWHCKNKLSAPDLRTVGNYAPVTYRKLPQPPLITVGAIWRLLLR